VAGRVTADITAKGASDKPALNGQLSARDVVVSGKDLPQPVRVSAISLNLTPQAIQSNDFAVSTGATNVNMRFGLSNYATVAPAVDATLKAANANLAELLNMAHAYGVSAVDGVSG